MAWKELKSIDGRTVYVNLGAVTYIALDGALSDDVRSFIGFVGGAGNGGSITIAVRATPAEILKGEAVS